MKRNIIYILYFLSFYPIYHIGTQVIGAVALLGLGFSEDIQKGIGITILIIELFITIGCPILLNSFYKSLLKLKNNNKLTWGIFVAHLIIFLYIYFPF